MTKETFLSILAYDTQVRYVGDIFGPSAGGIRLLSCFSKHGMF